MLIMALPPPAWYPDPKGGTALRYWDGAAWTDHYAYPHQQQPSASITRFAPPTTPVTATPHDARMNPFAHSRRRSTKVRPSLVELVRSMQHEAPRQPLDEQIEVAGETHHVGDIKRVFRAHGMPIGPAGATLEQLTCTMVPEPWNPYDPNAVAVMIGEQHVGYLPAEDAEEYAEPLNELASRGILTTGQARIWAKDEAGVVWARVTVLLPYSEEL